MPLLNVAEICLYLRRRLLNSMKSKHFYSLLFRKILGDQLQFSVREIRTLDFCNQEECKNEEFFLDEFGRTIQKTSEPVCLAHIFTYRDFPGGTQGHNASIQFFKEHSYLYGLAFSQNIFQIWIGFDNKFCFFNQ